MRGLWYKKTSHQLPPVLNRWNSIGLKLAVIEIVPSLFLYFKFSVQLYGMQLRRLFLQHMAQTSLEPLLLEIDKASGVYLYDKDGKKYLDLIAGISVSALGHCHPAVVQAVQEQAARYMHTMVYGEYVLSPQVMLAEFLCDILPEQLNSVYFVNSGAEATEGAMKLAKRYTGKTEIISCNGAYHGSTQGALSLMGNEMYKDRYRPLLPDTRQIRYNTPEDIALITSKTAAVFVEPVQAETGVTMPDKEWLIELRKRCTETGALLVFDEIQTGCGRTGRMFAFEHTDVQPDILLLAKGLGGGMPIGAFISNQWMMHALTYDPPLGHITTFGGHPVNCAAALATLQTLWHGSLICNVERKAALFLEKLQHPVIHHITHKGLLMALHIGDTSSVQRIIKYCLDNGVITDWFLYAPDCIRIAPPLIITEEEIEDACKVILQAMDSL
jgi:acetylornithine/N-succinyldiaminopimelate aminotransferase